MIAANGPFRLLYFMPMSGGPYDGQIARKYAPLDDAYPSPGGFYRTLHDRGGAKLVFVPKRGPTPATEEKDENE